jgi:hypothetical protein
MTADLATRWANTVVPSWLYRWLMPAGWLAAIVVSVASDTGRCSVEDPTVCGPDRTFSLAMIACVASLVLWWWQPRLAAAAGLLFLVPELRYDDVEGARTAWTVYATACAVVLAWMALSRRRQRALTADVPRRQVMIPPAKSVGLTSRLIVAAVLVVVGAAALGVMRWQDQREEVHVRRAVEQIATAGDTDDDGDLKLTLPDGSTRTVTVLDDYEPGARIPVLIDPADAHWIRLRAELADYTFWYTVAGGVWTLAVLLVLRDIRLRRARPREAWTSAALPIRIDPDVSATFAIRSADGAVLLGFLPVDLDDKEADGRLFTAFDLLDEEEAAGAPAALRREWARTLRRYQNKALLAGDLAEGGWPTILIGDVPLRPAAPFRAPRRTPWSVESVEGLPADLELTDPDAPVPHSSVEPTQTLPTLPWEVPIEPVPWWARPALVGIVVAAPVAVGALAAWDDWIAALVGLSIAGRSMHYLGERVFYRVVATATEVRIRTGWFERVLNWRSVASVQIDEDRVSLETEEDWHVIDGIRSGQTARVAAVFETLRLRARIGLPTPAGRRQIAPALLIEGGCFAVCALVLALTLWNPF